MASQVALFQIAALAVVVGSLLWMKPLGSGRSSGGRRLFGRIAERRPWAVAVVGAVCFVVNAGPGLLVYTPVPVVQDEFSYLLMGDTFAEGRLTNPTPSLAEHFETHHVIVRPTRQSKYPPGQGVALALGQVAFGMPIVGVWLSLAAASAAVCWMLQGWVPPRWALAGGLLTVCNPHVFMQWGQSYWGGAVAMLGGAWFFGGFRRLMATPHARDAILMALGLAVLANSRPYEGLVASLPAAAVLAAWMLGRSGPPAAVSVLKILCPVALVLGVTAGGMAFHNVGVTGSPLRLPYQVWLEQQRIGSGGTPDAADAATPVHIRAEQAGRRQWDEELRQRRTVSFFVGRLFHQYSFHVGLLLTAPVLAAVLVGRGFWTLFAIGTVAAEMLAISLNLNTGWPHYTAPVAPLAVYLAVQGLRLIATSRPHGATAAWSLVAACCFSFAMFVAVVWIGKPVSSQRHWSLERDAIQRRLAAGGSKHLVVVAYAADHDWNVEWVYNRADIDAAAVVWARDLGPAADRRLLAHFPDRKAWRIEPDGGRFGLEPIGADANRKDMRPDLSVRPEPNTQAP